MVATFLALGAILVGLAVGWIAGRHAGKRELEAYRAGVEETLRQGGRFCWVRSQLPPNADD